MGKMKNQITIKGKTYYVFPLEFIEKIVLTIYNKNKEMIVVNSGATFNTTGQSLDLKRTINTLTIISNTILRFSYNHGYYPRSILVDDKVFDWLYKRYEEELLPF